MQTHKRTTVKGLTTKWYCQFIQHKDHYIHYLPSSSIIFTVAVPGLPRVTPLGNDPGTIIILKSSSFSNMLSSTIEMLNGTIVTPAGIVTVYGPGP